MWMDKGDIQIDNTEHQPKNLSKYWWYRGLYVNTITKRPKIGSKIYAQAIRDVSGNIAAMDSRS